LTEEPLQRFSGPTRQMRGFFELLDREPCPESWPGGDRVTYIKDVLGPLKALTQDLADRLTDVRPRLALVPRVGASLGWPRELAPATADCAVRTVRAWDASATPDTSPLLQVTFTGEAVRIGLEADDRGCVAGLRRALLGADEGPRRIAATLLGRGWTLGGPRSPDAEDGAIPPDIRPWLRREPLHVTRSFAWEPWLEEPAFVDEVADGFRELLPLFQLLRLPRPAARAAAIPGP
jgi:hypothetical protein